jgi:hypothetical protein
MFVVKYQDLGNGKVISYPPLYSKDAAIQTAKSLIKKGRWIIVFDVTTGLSIYSKRD